MALASSDPLPRELHHALCIFTPYYTGRYISTYLDPSPGERYIDLYSVLSVVDRNNLDKGNW